MEEGGGSRRFAQDEEHMRFMDGIVHSYLLKRELNKRCVRSRFKRNLGAVLSFCMRVCLCVTRMVSCMSFALRTAWVWSHAWERALTCARFGDEAQSGEIVRVGMFVCIAQAMHLLLVRCTQCAGAEGGVGYQACWVFVRTRHGNSRSYASFATSGVP
jgi:hypothetical protein